MDVRQASLALRRGLDAARLDVPYVYQPLDYAWAPHEEYCRRFGGGGQGRVLLVGMNPGPHGMAQTGVPFGDVVFVRDWMGIHGHVGAPPRMHPNRPIQGFGCKRREPSGSRLYGWARERYGLADAFFSQFFIANYCPLLFFDADGKNLTPPQLSVAARAAVEGPCDEHLANVVRAVRPRLVVGVGTFAEARARTVMEARSLGVPVGGILHPSPASPAANRGWAPQAEAQLAGLGVKLPAAPAAG